MQLLKFLSSLKKKKRKTAIRYHKASTNSSKKKVVNIGDQNYKQKMTACLEQYAY